MAEAWQYIYSGQLLILFLLAQMAPIFFEVWMEAGMGWQTAMRFFMAMGYHGSEFLEGLWMFMDVYGCLWLIIPGGLPS